MEKNNIPFIDLLSNPFKMQNHPTKSKSEKNDQHSENEDDVMYDDDNEEILRLLKARLQLGRDRYGHGMIVEDDTTKYGTHNNDWHLMAEEEVLDGLIYAAASIIRYRRIRQMVNKKKIMDDFDIKY